MSLETRPRRPQWLLLAFMLALALVGAFFCMFLANLLGCGVSGCSGGGFGPAYGSFWDVLWPLLLGAGMLFAAISVPAWAKLETRLWTAGCVALAYVLLIGVPLWSELPVLFP